ncbi:MAG: rhamnan synthesis F family protein [Pseudomonadota bacterium]|nr:rhamnan synthesis F family protein [Pseudomonadota bacterium]
MKNTLALYTFYEKDGIVKNDILHYLKELKKEISKIVVIVNGKISPEGRLKLEELNIDILVRENKGLDFGAWKAGIEYIGWDNIRKLNGLLLCNCTCYGPIYPFKEMFDKMALKDCDFWGINRHPELNVYLVPENNKSKILEHIQSYFLFFKPHLLKSNHFKKWWDELIEYSDYNYEVGLHETKFTAYLENAGYKSASYMDFDKYKKLFNDNASVQCCDIQLIQDRNPLVKKKIFSTDYRYYLPLSSGSQAADLVQFIKEKTAYNINYIYDDIITHNKLSFSKTVLHLNYILPTNTSSVVKKETIALLMYIYYEDCIDYCFNYAKSLPKSSDIYLIVSNASIKDKCLQKFKTWDFNNVECQVMKNRGRDVAAYLLFGKDIFEKYDYVCCMHDKKSPSYGTGITGYHYAEHCFKSTLYNTDYVNNVIKTFEENPQIGMLVPPTLNFSVFYHTLGKEMWMEEENVKSVLKMLNFNIPFDEQSVIPFGTMFWVRGKAFLPMFNHNWKYEDFPKEPCPAGCTILHAIERAYPFAPQEAGYLVGMVMPDCYASVILDNQLYMLRNLNISLFNKFGVSDFITLEKNIKINTSAISNNGLNNEISIPKLRKAIRFYSVIEYYFYKFLSKVTFGKAKTRAKQKKKFWKYTRKQYGR